MQDLKPMDAVAALYSGGRQELSEAIVASLSRAIFGEGKIRPSGRARRTLARAFYRILQWTTTSRMSADEKGSAMTVFNNVLLERSGHPYARSLLGSSKCETASLVEGGDPMNGPYMMIAPEIRMNSTLWDRLFLDSVQARDVQSRFVWETRATYELARRRLEGKQPVRLKAVAAGTGLSMILAYDKLVRDGHDPALITVKITDREESNVEKACRLLHKLATTRGNRRGTESGHGISAEIEDIFPESGTAGSPDRTQYDIVTAIGILEYFQGCSHATTEQKLRLDAPDEPVTAHGLVARLTEMTTDRASLIVNTYRDDASTRILELFGRRFDYRHREHLRSLLESVDFRSVHLAGSGNIYDVEIYEKNPRQGDGVVLVPVRGTI
jgi:hypothetical protein